MKFKSGIAALLAASVAVSAAYAGSTVNPNIPALKDPLNSPPIQQNFQATFNDITNILGKFASRTPPTNPTQFQEWADLTTSPVAVFKYWNAGTAAWVPFGTFNTATGVFSAFSVSGGFLRTAPITVSVSGGVVTYGLATDSNFATVGGQLAFANIADGSLLARCSSGMGEPTACTWPNFAAQAIGATNGIFPHFVGGIWTTDTTGTSGHAVPFLDGTNFWSGGTQTFLNITPSTSPTTGALTVAGGVGIAGAVNAGATSSINDPSALAVGIGGELNLTGSSAGGNIPYAGIKAFATNGTAGRQAGDLEVLTANGGTFAPWGRFTSAGTIAFNTGGTLAPSTSGVMTLPAGTDTLVGTTLAQELAAKTLTTPTINGGTLSGTFSGAPAFSGANFITNANLVQAGAATLKGNPTAAMANEVAFTIQGLTNLAAPNATLDFIPIIDHLTGTIKNVTPGAITTSAVAGVASYNTRAGAVVATGTDVPLRGYIAGLTLSTSGASATFGVAAGVATNDTNATMMALASALTKTTASWAAGTGNGGLDTGTIAVGTWYHVFLMQRPDTGAVDICESVTVTGCTTGGNIPAAYTLFRRIGSMKTDASSHWTAFTQLGDEFLWATMVEDVNGAAIGAAAILQTLSVPTGVQVDAIISGLHIGPAGVFISVTSPDTADVPPAISSFTGVETGVNIPFNTAIRTSTLGQIRMRAVSTTTAMFVITQGWIDSRGKLQ